MRIFPAGPAECDKIPSVKLSSQPPAISAPEMPLAFRTRRQFHDTPGDIIFRAALAPLALVAALLAIPVDEARAHNDNSAMFHAATYPLHKAASKGNLDSVNHFLSVHGASVNAEGLSGWRPLHEAAHRHISVVSVLIAMGADVRAESNDGRTPLHHAGNVSIVSMLLSAGADVNARSSSGSTPLLAVVGGATRARASAASALIAAGASVNVTNNMGWTPLHNAASAGNTPAITVLSVAGADVGAKSNAGRTPLHVVARFGGGAAAVWALFVAGADINTKSKYGWTPLHSAARYDQISAVSALIAVGADVNMKSDGGGTPLGTTWNALGGFRSAKSASVLIAAGGHWGTSCVGTGFTNPAGPRPPCLSGALFCRNLASPQFYSPTLSAQFYSPTLSACSPYDECLAAGDCALSWDVCWRGFDPDRFYDREAGECVPYVECHPTATAGRYTNQCECPYSSRRYMRPDGSCVSSCDRAETVAGYQCECTADTATNVNGACELLYPCHDSAVRQADNSGCECPTGTFAHGDPSGGYHRSRSSDRYGERPIIPDTAICHAGHAPIPHNPSGWESAVYANNPTLVAHFISGHGRDPDENHALHLAAEGGHYLAAKTLIESGADINLKRYYGSGYGDPPLHFAVRNRRAKLITLLLRRGADADAQSDDDGDTALHLAAQRPDAAENAGLIAFLLDAGADPNVRNDDGWRPLDLAYHGGTPSDLTWQARRGMMAALIAGGATWSDECTSGAIPNENYRPSSGIADCVCPLHISERDSRGRCECPAHSHAQVNGRCLPKDSAQVEAEIVKMEAELLRLRTELVSLNARISAAADMPREAVEEIAEQAGETAQEIKRRRDNFVALARADLAGAPPPPVAMSDTAAECRMLGGEVQIHSATGIRVCSGIDANDTFCLVDSADAYPCRGFFRHVRRCNDDYNRRALNPFFCGARCGERAARGDECE